MRRLGSFLVDNPSVVTLIMVAAVLVQYVSSWLWWPSLAPGNLFNALDPATRSSAVSELAIGVAGVAAMVGGFAGVVVVFGLSSDDDRFRQVRLKAATSLRRNWMSVVTTPLVAAFGSIIAAAIASGGATGVAAWLLELCVLLAAHGAVRLVVVLFELVKVVNASDEAANRVANTADTDDFLDG